MDELESFFSIVGVLGLIWFFYIAFDNLSPYRPVINDSFSVEWVVNE